MPIEPGLPAFAFAIAPLIAFFVAAAAPGPATLGVAATAMARGRRAGLAFGAGLSLGLALWGVAAALGLGPLLQGSASALTVLRVLGGLFLIYLAVRAAQAALAPPGSLPGPDAASGAGPTAAPPGAGPTGPLGAGQTAAPLRAGQTAAPLGAGQTGAPLGAGQTGAPLGVGQTAAPLGVGQTAAPQGVGQTAAPLGAGALFVRGLLLNLLNPKAALAWAAVLALGMPATGGDAPAGAIAAITLACALLGAAIYAGYALAFAQPPVRALYARGRRGIEAVAAAVFGLAGLRLLLARDAAP
ncbi:MAG: LysE family transporter [Pseudomonadota bacterium]